MAVRRPRGVYERGTDPDPRFSLANERTFLAWMRTALGLVAGAAALQAPALELDRAPRIALSGGVLALAAACLAQGWLRWRRSEAAMRTGEELPGFTGGLVVALGVGAVILGVLALVVTVHD